MTNAVPPAQPMSPLPPARPAPRPRIGVIMPAYNEADRVEQTLETIAGYWARGAKVSRIFLADDGSTDSTIEIADHAARALDLPLEILRLPHRGKAWTVRTAMLQVAASTDLDYLMMLDADDELRIDQLDRVVWADDPRTIYIGRRSRTIADNPGATPSPFRRVMSGVMRLASRILLGINFRDTQCGFKLFPRAIAADLFGQQRSTSWTFDAELLLIANRISGIPVQEVDVTWSPRGTSKVGLAAPISSGVALLGTALNRARGVYRPIGLSRVVAPAPGAPSAPGAPVVPPTGSTGARRAGS
jgi:glycosyltransferase involved in cell wall biosynthesis